MSKHGWQYQALCICSVALLFKPSLFHNFLSFPLVLSLLCAWRGQLRTILFPLLLFLWSPSRTEIYLLQCLAHCSHKYCNTYCTEWNPAPFCWSSTQTHWAPCAKKSYLWSRKWRNTQAISEKLSLKSKCAVPLHMSWPKNWGALSHSWMTSNR